MSELRAIDLFFERLPEPTAGCLAALRGHLKTFHPELRETLKYGMPFYYYKNRMCCYLWTQRQSGQPYLGLVNGAALNDPDLVQDKRKRMKILLLDPEQDVPLDKITELLLTVMAAADAGR